MARLAHQMAVESARVASDVVSVEAFPELARRYGVTSVPHVLVDEARSLLGSLKPGLLVDALLEGGRSRRFRRGPAGKI